MAVVAKVGTLQCPASTGPAAVTGVGFEPQALIFWYTTRTTDGASPHAMLGMGVATAATERYAWGIKSDDNVATTVVQQAVSDALCVALATNDAGTTGLAADLDSLDADGFTLDWSIVTSGADVHYLALGGMTDAKAHGFALPTGTGGAARTGVGFEPDAALFLAGSAAAAALAGGHARANVSAADGTTTASLALTLGDFSSTANGFYALETAELLRLIGTTGVNDGTGDLTSFDADGFTLNVADGYAAAYLACALCLLGASVKVGTVTVPAGTGTQATAGVGFEPAAVLFFAGHAAASSTTRDAFAACIGAASGATARAVVSAAQVDASDPTAADHDSDTTKVVKALTAGTPTVDWAADLDSLDDNGFTLDWTTVGTGASTDQLVYVAFGGGAAAPAVVARSQGIWIGI